MSLWTIAWRSIQRRSVASALTAFSMALGVALVVAVLLILGVVSESFRSNSSLGYNLVVGAKGGRLQLVLNTVYYLSQPVENIPYDYYLEFLNANEVRAELADDQLNELVQLRRRRLNPAQRQELDELTPPEQTERLLKGRFADLTYQAIPIAMGDYYKKYRSVGTSPRLFDDLVYDVENNRKFEFAQGENFERHSEKYGYFGAVVGATVAREQKLKLGDKIVPSHGSSEEEGGEAHVHDPFHIVGILAPTGTPNDRAVFVNIEGFLLMAGHAKDEDEIAPEYVDDNHEHEAPSGDDHDHGAHAADGDSDHGEHDEHGDEDTAAGESHADHELADDAKHEGQEHEGHTDDAHCSHCHDHSEPLPLAQRELSALLVRTTSDPAAMIMKRSINKGPVAQAVLPVAEITILLMMFVNPLRWLLLSITVMICIVSGIGILVSIYNSMSDRRHEIAVMRALGAGRSTVMIIVLLESLILAIGGGLVGWLGGHAVIGLARPWVVGRFGVPVSVFDLAPPVLNLGISAELLLIPGLIVLAVIVGLLPAIAAYRTDVAKALGGS
jgi:putative ABC transport system permease protein